MPYAPVPWHFTGIHPPLPVSRPPSEDQRKTGCNPFLSVDCRAGGREVSVFQAADRGNGVEARTAVRVESGQDYAPVRPSPAHS